MPFKDREKGLKNKRRYWKKNRNILLTKKKEYYIKNKDKILKNVKEYGRKNKEKIKEQTKKYRQKNKEIISIKHKLWAHKNKEQIKVKNKKEYSKKKELYLEKRKQYSEQIKNIVFSYYGWICNCCGETGKSFLNIDHVNNDGYKDLSPSGRKYTGTDLWRKIIKENFPNKYQVLCSNCNWSKYKNKGICEHKLINNG